MGSAKPAGRGGSHYGVRVIDDQEVNGHGKFTLAVVLPPFQLLDPFDPWGYADLRMSEFRVRRTEEAALHLEETWLTAIG